MPEIENFPLCGLGSFFCSLIVTKLVQSMARGSSRTRNTKVKNNKGATEHNFASYNVLCSHLAGSNHFRYCKPEFLDRAYRLPLILEKLEAEVSKNSVIALQEVGQEWAEISTPSSPREATILCAGTMARDLMITWVWVLRYRHLNTKLWR